MPSCRNKSSNGPMKNWFPVFPEQENPRKFIKFHELPGILGLLVVVVGGEHVLDARVDHQSAADDDNNAHRAHEVGSRVKDRVDEEVVHGVLHFLAWFVLTCSTIRGDGVFVKLVSFFRVLLGSSSWFWLCCEGNDCPCGTRFGRIPV